MDQEKIGNLFKERREAKNITQQELADILDVTDRAISNWEHGRRLPDYSLLARLCDVLSISLDEIFTLGKRKEDKNQSIKEINEMIDYYFQNHSIDDKDGLIDDYNTFNFVVGESNGDVFCRLYEIANNMKKINPLYIYGPRGSGKTHLVQWFGNYCKDNYDKKVLYINGKTFNDDCYNLSIGHKKIQSFVNKYKQADIIIVDDMQNIVGSKSVLEFYHLLDYILDNKIQLIMTGDNVSGDLRLDDQIKERIGGCYHIPIEEVDIITRKKILRNIIKDFPKVKIQDEVIIYIAYKTQHMHAKVLKESISNLIAYALIENTKEISLEQAKIALKDLINNDIEVYNKPIKGNYQFYKDKERDLLIKLNRRTKRYKIFAGTYDDEKNVKGEWLVPSTFIPYLFDKVPKYDFKKLEKVRYQEDIDDYIEIYLDKIKDDLSNDEIEEYEPEIKTEEDHDHLKNYDLETDSNGNQYLVGKNTASMITSDKSIEYYIDAYNNLLIKNDLNTGKYYIFTIEVRNGDYEKIWCPPEKYDPELRDEVMNYDFSELEKIENRYEAIDYINDFLADVILNYKEDK